MFSRYAVPLFFVTLSFFVVIGDPSEKLSTRMPLITGEYQYLVAAGFLLVGLILGAVVYFSGKKDS